MHSIYSDSSDPMWVSHGPRGLLNSGAKTRGNFAAPTPGSIILMASLSSASLSSTNANRRSRRARVACEVCHERKVRCDGVANGFPCTNCRLDSKACTFRPSRRKRRPAPTIQENSPDADSSPSPSPNALDAFSLHGFLSAGDISQLAPATLDQLEAQGCLHVPGGAALGTFVRHYFLYVQPCSPVVDEALFWEIYQRRDEAQGRWSLLLFQAMLFTSASVRRFSVCSGCKLTVSSMFLSRLLVNVAMSPCLRLAMPFIKKPRLAFQVA